MTSEPHGNRGTPESAIVVGAGIVGASTAYFLAQEGVKVTLVEREHPGWGASGRNAGYISMITRSAGAQLDLATLSRSLYEQLAGEIDNFDFRAAGALVYYYEDQAPLIEAFVAHRASDGLPIGTVDPDTGREMCPLLPDDVAGGIHSRSDAYIHPKKFVDAIIAAARPLGARVVTGNVVGLEAGGGRCTGVRTTDGRMGADAVVLTTGSWTSRLLADVGAPLHLFHIRLQAAETAPIDARFDVQLYGPGIFHEYGFIRDVPEYDDDLVLHPLQRIMPQVGLLETLVQRADGRLLLGCPIEFVEDPDTATEPTVAGLAQMFGVLGDHVPAVQNIPVERVWSGVTPQTGDGVPVMDAVAGIDGLFVGSGHAYGATVGVGSGRVLADRILGRPERIDIAPFRYDRPAVTERMARAVMYS
jgi:glycine/D-amino acid oxidase-like deaminating enzyme